MKQRYTAILIASLIGVLLFPAVASATPAASSTSTVTTGVPAQEEPTESPMGSPSTTSTPTTPAASSTSTVTTGVPAQEEPTESPTGSPSTTSTPTLSPTATTTPTTSTETPTGNDTFGPTAPNESVLVVDDGVAVTDWWYDHNTNEFVITFYADRFATLTMLASPDGDAEAGSLEYNARALDQGREQVARIKSTVGITMWTEQSSANGRAVYLRAPDDNPLSGPYDSEDVRNAAIGAAIGVVLAVLFEAVAAKLSAAGSAERVA